MEQILSGNQWEVMGVWPYAPILNRSVELGIELKGITKWLPAIVPGGIHKDLLRNGLIEDPYYEMNSLKCEWVSTRWWIYRTCFTPEVHFERQRCELVLKGIDYKAHIYLNGNKLGEHEGMYIPFQRDVTEALKYHEENELCVVLESAPEEMSQFGYTDRTKTQKSRFNYKWDFGTRLINLGLYDDVLLKFSGEVKVKEYFVHTSIDGDMGRVGLDMLLESKGENQCRMSVEIEKENMLICRKEWKLDLICGENPTNVYLEIENPELWYPNGYGSQPLYNLKVTIRECDQIWDELSLRTGFRTLSYENNDDAPEGALPYVLVVNGKKIYTKGVNMVPLDHFYGSIGYSEYSDLLKLAKEGNINLIRVWGGGLIEKEQFYDLCDECGILIWQEFIQSSSGISNKPSGLKEFMEILQKVAVFTVKSRRNHISHAVWSGGNELTDENGVPVTYQDNNIAMLKSIVEKHDKGKLMLPSSASGPNEFLDVTRPGTNHDVHGPWKYEGAKEHYRLYNLSDSLLHSEFGVDGLTHIESMRKFLSNENIKVTDMNENLVWRHHGDWWDTRQRDEAIFGEIDDIETYIKCSQFIQAEGLRYALESNRRRMFKNSGSIIWQMNEPWPNVSCTCLIDYYNVPKLAYYYVKKAYSPVHVSMKYESLLYYSGENFKGEVFVHNDLDGFKGSLRIAVTGENGIVREQKERKFDILENQCRFIDELSFPVMELGSWFTIRLDLSFECKCCSNIYHFIVRDAQDENVSMKKAQLLLNEVFSNKWS